MPSPPSLSVDCLSKSFGPNRAVSDISFSANDGSIIAVAGNNGAGKSTLLRIIAGSLPADQGAIYVDDIALNNGSVADARRYGVVMAFQNNPLCPHLSVLENLFLGIEPTTALGFSPVSRMKSRAELITEKYRLLLPSFDVSASELSGGQQRSVVLARALLSEPKVLLLDEPTSSLSNSQATQLIDTLINLSDNGVRIIFSTHSEREIRDIAQRVILLNMGVLTHDLLVNHVSAEELALRMSGI